MAAIQASQRGQQLGAPSGHAGPGRAPCRQPAPPRRAVVPGLPPPLLLLSLPLLLLPSALQDEMGEHAVTAVVATWPGEDEQPEVHFEVGAACLPACACLRLPAALRAASWGVRPPPPCTSACISSLCCLHCRT